MCCLRGLLYLRLYAAERAKEAFMEALSLDVKCYDAFDRLVSGGMLTADEGSSPSFHLSSLTLTHGLLTEWNFVQGLQFKAQTGDDAEFIQLIYTARLRKVRSVYCSRLCS